MLVSVPSVRRQSEGLTRGGLLCSVHPIVWGSCVRVGGAIATGLRSQDPGPVPPSHRVRGGAGSYYRHQGVRGQCSLELVLSLALPDWVPWAGNHSL